MESILNSYSLFSEVQPFSLMMKFPLERRLSIVDEEMNKDMKLREMKRPNFDVVNDQVFSKCRSIVVEWMAQVGDACHISNLTTHIAVHIYDYFTAVIKVPRSTLQLVASSSILIACKLEETFERVPRVVELNCLTDNTYKAEHIIQMETVILNNLNWDVCFVTSLHFLGIYLKVSLDIEFDLLDNRPITESQKELLQALLDKQAEFLVDMCRQVANFLIYRPSIVASTCIAISRKVMKITPFWSPILAYVTKYNDHDLQPCFKQVWSVFQENFPPYGTWISLKKKIRKASFLCIDIPQKKLLPFDDDRFCYSSRNLENEILL